MKTLLFVCAGVSAVGMLLAMTALVDHGQIRGVDGYKKVWRSFRASRSGKLWAACYGSFLFFYLILLLGKYRWIDL